MRESRYDNSNKFDLQPTTVGSFSKFPSSNLFSPSDASQAMLFNNGENFQKSNQIQIDDSIQKRVKTAANIYSNMLNQNQNIVLLSKKVKNRVYTNHILNLANSNSNMTQRIAPNSATSCGFQTTKPQKRRHISFSNFQQAQTKPSYLDVPLDDYENFIQHLEVQLQKVQCDKEISQDENLSTNNDKRQARPLPYEQEQSRLIKNQKERLRQHLQKRIEKLSQIKDKIIQDKKEVIQSTEKSIVEQLHFQKEREVDADIDYHMKFNKNNLNKQLVDMEQDINQQYLLKVVRPVEATIANFQKAFRRQKQLRKFGQIMERVIILKNFVKKFVHMELKYQCQGTFIILKRLCELKYERKKRFEKKIKRINWINERQVQKLIVNHVRYTVITGILNRFYNKFVIDVKNEKINYPGKPQINEKQSKNGFHFLNQVQAVTRGNTKMKSGLTQLENKLNKSQMAQGKNNPNSEQLLQTPLPKFAFVSSNLQEELSKLRSQRSPQPKMNQTRIEVRKLGSTDNIISQHHLENSEISTLSHQFSMVREFHSREGQFNHALTQLGIQQRMTQLNQPIVLQSQHHMFFLQFLKCLKHVEISRQGIEKRSMLQQKTEQRKAQMARAQQQKKLQIQQQQQEQQLKKQLHEQQLQQSLLPLRPLVKISSIRTNHGKSVHHPLPQLSARNSVGSSHHKIQISEKQSECFKFMQAMFNESQEFPMRSKKLALCLQGESELISKIDLDSISSKNYNELLSHRESTINISERKRQQQLYQNTTPQTNQNIEIFNSITGGQQIIRIDSDNVQINFMNGQAQRARNTFNNDTGVQNRTFQSGFNGITGTRHSLGSNNYDQIELDHKYGSKLRKVDSVDGEDSPIMIQKL
ncbi:UNKNOWN [Stylonychia lemnae]|uniref:Uncharacterized protein n=1 Tax=Stylonychia lemnae TaxID=5949 RepID=A0A078A4H3_STYLE|nr:UNKNOWN [Stylonychia lemnae]|eukprot:CDW76794.1 UNKNOWN [Stylonychia lemnae]